MSFLRRGEDTFAGGALIFKRLMSMNILAELMLESPIFVGDKSDWFMFVLLAKGAKALVRKVSELAQADNCCLKMSLVI